MFGKKTKTKRTVHPAKQPGIAGNGAELIAQKIPDGMRSDMKAETTRLGMPVNWYPAGQNVIGMREINRIATVKLIPSAKAKTGHQLQFPARMNIRANVKHAAVAQ